MFNVTVPEAGRGVQGPRGCFMQLPILVRVDSPAADDRFNLVVCDRGPPTGWCLPLRDHH